MAKKPRPKNKRKKKSPTVPTIGTDRYIRILSVLIGGYDVREGHDVYYDLGPGERPQVALAHFREVARREGFDVTILFATSQKKSLVLQFHEAPTRKRVETYDEDGVLIAEEELDTSQ